jgi:hypothetical protein
MIRFILIGCLFTLSTQASETLTVETGSQQTAVVELYTSEGCSSCPPADQWLEALVETDSDEIDVLALAFHVDYWDYIGWKDRFGNPKYTSRQRQLGANNKQSSIYTPEFFVDGKEARGTRNVLKQIYAANESDSSIHLKLNVTKEGNHFLLELEPRSGDLDAKMLHHRYFVYEKNLVSDVTRGENSGETLSHQNVVRYMSRARKLNQTNQFNITIDPDWQLENIGVAALVTTPGNLSYLQAIHTLVEPLLLN